MNTIVDFIEGMDRSVIELINNNASTVIINFECILFYPSKAFTESLLAGSMSRTASDREIGGIGAAEDLRGSLVCKFFYVIMNRLKTNNLSGSNSIYQRIFCINCCMQLQVISSHNHLKKGYDKE